MSVYESKFISDSYIIAASYVYCILDLFIAYLILRFGTPDNGAQDIFLKLRLAADLKANQSLIDKASIIEHMEYVKSMTNSV